MNPAYSSVVRKTTASNTVRIPILRNNYQQQINDLLESVALLEISLTIITNAEGGEWSMMRVTTQELLCINWCVEDMMACIVL